MKLAVSACLLGHRCRYNGKELEALDLEGFNVLPLCPELLGGLPVPRPPAEIKGSRVINLKGEDLSEAFARGAKKALELMEAQGVTLVLLKENSPSCGVKRIYDGSFTGKKTPGKGIFTRLVEEKNYRVFSEEEMDLLRGLRDEK